MYAYDAIDDNQAISLVCDNLYPRWLFNSTYTKNRLYFSYQRIQKIHTDKLLVIL